MDAHFSILFGSLILLAAYFIERFGRRHRLPSVILLIAAGMAVKPLLHSFGWSLEGLETAVPRELEQAGLTVLHETVSSRASSAGRFVSVSVQFKAASRADYEAAHHALRAHPEIKWTL